MLRVHGVSKKFLNTSVIDNISLDIPVGKITTLLGQNGAGKSTLLKLMSGYELPDAGRVEYLGVDLSSYNFQFKHDIKFVHENLVLNFPFSVKEYVNIIKQEFPSWNQKYFDEMTQERNIDLHKRFQEYSRGQKMQIALMISLASAPKVLLLDEITSVIDVYGRKYFLDKISNFTKEGGTVVITSNIIDELEFYADHLIIIKNKSIALNTDIRQLANNFIKIRINRDDYSKIENYQKKLVWAGVNSDLSISYIISKNDFEEFKELHGFVDKRKSTLEDVFIFYFAKES